MTEAQVYERLLWRVVLSLAGAGQPIPAGLELARGTARALERQGLVRWAGPHLTLTGPAQGYRRLDTDQRDALGPAGEGSPDWIDRIFADFEEERCHGTTTHP